MTGVPTTVFALETETVPADDSVVMRFESEEDDGEAVLSSPHGETEQKQPEQNDISDGKPEPDDSERETTGDVEAAPQPEADAIPSAMSLGFSSAEEFRELLSDNEGGVVTLTGDVVCDDYWDTIEIEKPTTILMEDYSIHIPPDACLRISGPVRFEGNGVMQPLFYIEDTLNANGVEIVATGDGATVLYATKYIYLECVSITAQGKDSVGVHGTDSVELNQCAVTANGAAIVSDTGEIWLDGCRVLPEPDNAEVIRREAVPGNRIQENGICVSVGGSLEDVLSSYKQADYYLLDTERRASAAGFMASASWENLPADTSKSGKYPILCVPTGVPDWFPIEGIISYEVPLHIIAGNQPHIEFASSFFDTVMLGFFSEIMDYDALTLWYSSDGGQTWRDFERIEGSSVSPYGAFAEALESNHVYLFRLEVTGGPMAGDSKTLVFPYYDSDPDREGGGDRTGADRFPQTGSGGGVGNSTPPGDGNGPDDETETGGDKGSQPDDGDGDGIWASGDNGSQTGKENGPGDANSETGTGGNIGYGNATISSLSIVEEELPEDTIRSNTAVGVPPLGTDITAPAFRFDGDANASAYARLQPVAEEADSQKELPISTTAASSDLINASPEADTAKAQPSLPQPPFQASAAMAVTGSAAAVLAGASAWIKIRRLRKR